MNDEVQLKTKKKKNLRFNFWGPKSTALLKRRVSRGEGDGVGGISSEVRFSLGRLNESGVQVDYY